MYLFTTQYVGRARAGSDAFVPRDATRYDRRNRDTIDSVEIGVGGIGACLQLSSVFLAVALLLSREDGMRHGRAYVSAIRVWEPSRPIYPPCVSCDIDE